MSKSEVKPLELWVLKDATHDYLTWEPTRHTISDFHHMINYESYQALQKENEELRTALSEIKAYKWCPHCHNDVSRDIATEALKKD